MLFIGLLILVHITWSSARQSGCDERGPICGNDGKTYATMCQLIWARLQDTDLAVLHDGSCNGKYTLSGISEPSGSEVITGPGKLLMKHVKNRGVNHEKIKAIMPVGWPPLGPMLVTKAREELKAVEEKKNLFKPQPI